MILEMELLSDAIPGSGEGLSGIIDIDVACDEYGIPNIPAKRIKGVLRESALELQDAGILHHSIEDIFGTAGQKEGTAFKISDGYIENYPLYKELLDYTSVSQKKLAPLFNKEMILANFTYQRSRTTIDKKNGTAKEDTLRTSRVLKRGLKFYFHVEFTSSLEKEYYHDMEKICKITRRFGLSRTRGLGEIHISLLDNNSNEIPHQKKENPNAPLIAEEDRPDQLYKLILSMKNQSQLMVTSKTGKKQFSESFIPGSAILGLFANTFIKFYSIKEPHHDPVFRNLFLGGKVSFSDAYPEKQSYTFEPTPLFLHKEKDKCRYLNLSIEGDLTKIFKEEIFSKELSYEFIRVDDNGYLTPYTPETCIEYHHSRPEDKSIGHAEEGNGVFFQYTVLKAEENFQAEILGPANLLEKIVEICKNQEIFYLGKSKTAQYGKCSVHIKNKEKVENSEYQWMDQKSLVFTLVSGLVLRNQYGFINPEPSLFLEELAELLGISPGSLKIERQFLSFTSRGGFSGVWKLPRVQQNILKAGSVIVIKNNSGNTLDVGKIKDHRFGSDTREGFGRIKVNRLLRKLKLEVYEPESPPIPSSDNLSKIQDTIKRILLEHIRLQLKKTAIKKVEYLRNRPIPSNSFIGKLGMFIEHAQSFEELNEQFFARLKDKGKKQLEKIENHLHLKDTGKKQLDIPVVKKFLIEMKGKPEIDSSELRGLLKLAGIDELFFNDNQTAFKLYQYYAKHFLTTLRLMGRNQEEK